MKPRYLIAFVLLALAGLGAASVRGPVGRFQIADSFDRADNTDLGSAWDGNYSGFTNAQIVSNALRVVALGDPETAESYNVTTPGNNQWAQVRLRTFNTSTAGEVFGGVVLRAATPTTRTMYWIAAYTNNVEQFTVFRKRVAGTETEVSFTAQTWAQGDTLRVEVSGTTITIYRNGTQVEQQTDSDIAGGRIGVYLYVSASGAGTDLAVDDFAGGTL